MDRPSYHCHRSRRRRPCLRDWSLPSAASPSRCSSAAARLGDGACSWMAGGMLAPWCERATTDEAVAASGRAVDRLVGGGISPAPSARAAWSWRRPRDAADLTRFAARTERYEWLDADGIAALEPDLAGRFRRALFFRRRGAISIRAGRWRRWPTVSKRAASRSASASTCSPTRRRVDLVVDCRGLAARDALARPARRARRDGGGPLAATYRCRGRCGCCIRASRSTSCRAATACS